MKVDLYHPKEIGKALPPAIEVINTDERCRVSLVGLVIPFNLIRGLFVEECIVFGLLFNIPPHLPLMVLINHPFDRSRCSCLLVNQLRLDQINKLIFIEIELGDVSGELRIY